MADLAFGNAAYFDRLAGDLGDDFDWRALQRVRLDWCRQALARFGRPRYVRALDLGCGYGHSSAMLAPRCGEVLGVDGVADAIGGASSRYPHLRFQAGRLEDMEFPEGWFDLISALEVLYYVAPEARARVYERVVRWLAPGGDLLIAARMKDTPFFHLSAGDSLIPPGLSAAGTDDLRLGWSYTAEALCVRAVRWSGRRGLGLVAAPARALCGWGGWLRAAAALHRAVPVGAPTYRLWIARKPA